MVNRDSARTAGPNQLDRYSVLTTPCSAIKSTKKKEEGTFPFQVIIRNYAANYEALLSRNWLDTSPLGKQ